MITVNDINISSDSSSLDVSIAAPVGEVFVSGSIWTSSTYKSLTTLIDLTSLMSGTLLEVFSIPVATIGETAFNGVFFLEFTTDLGTTRTVAVSNLTIYNQCILDKLLKVTLVDCTPVEVNDCNESEPSTISTINTFLEGLCFALEQQDFLSIQKIETCIQKLCCNDCGCTDTTNTDNLTGNTIFADAVVKY
jgi:hypothetical protein